MIVGVLVEITNRNVVDKIFDYIVPKNLESDIKVGIRVSVPFGRMTLEGFVMEIKESSKLDDLKEIIDIVDKDVVLNDELLELTNVGDKIVNLYVEDNKILFISVIIKFFL